MKRAASQTFVPTTYRSLNFVQKGCLLPFVGKATSASPLFFFIPSLRIKPLRGRSESLPFSSSEEENSPASARSYEGNERVSFGRQPLQAAIPKRKEAPCPSCRSSREGGNSLFSTSLLPVPSYGGKELRLRFHRKSLPMEGRNYVFFLRQTASMPLRFPCYGGRQLGAFFFFFRRRRRRKRLALSTSSSYVFFAELRIRFRAELRIRFLSRREGTTSSLPVPKGRNYVFFLRLLRVLSVPKSGKDCT